MEIVAYCLAAAGFVFALGAMGRVNQLQKKVEELEKKVQDL